LQQWLRERTTALGYTYVHCVHRNSHGWDLNLFISDYLEDLRTEKRGGFFKTAGGIDCISISCALAV